MNFKNYFVNISLSILVCSTVFAQEKRLAKADENFNRFAFVDARKIYLEVAESGYSSPDLFKKLADSYYFNSRLEDAVPWYEKLVTTYENGIEPEYLFRYSQSLKSVERYEEADKAMEKFNTLSGNDQRADDNYNMYLSERRAKSTIKYIVEKGGINKSRVTGKGYGQMALVNSCTNDADCNEEQHQQNRRSQFIVIQ